MTISSKRAQYIAVISLSLSIVFFCIAFFIGRWSGFLAISAVSWLILSAALVWFVLALQFYTRSLAEREKLDLGDIARQQGASTIFQAGRKQTDLFAVAQRRLDIFEKWFLPISSAVIALYQLGIGGYLLRTTTAGVDLQPKQSLLCACCMTAIAFVSFLISRYATGMSAMGQWKSLRAGGSSFIGVAFICFILAVALAFAKFKIFIFVSAMAYVIPVMLMVLGAEIGLNVVVDIYRPRLKDRYARIAFDSRLLEIINEPGGMFRTAATAIDYQFGFKVSQTWFYKLLEKAVVPLVLFAVISLYLLSCVVVVAPNEEAIIEHLGNPVDNSGEVRYIGPGFAFKWPWPVDIVYKYLTKKISELSIGFVREVDKKTQKMLYGPILWGKSHYEHEEQILVASESGQAGEGSISVSLVVAAVPVQYRVKDIYSFIYNHDEPEKLLEAICYRELTRFAASAKIEVDNKADMDSSLLGAGRARAKRILTADIQAAADEAGLGVEIVFLGLQGIHPPAEVAEGYQKVIGAFQNKQALILDAYAMRNRDLSSLTGSVEQANELYELVNRYQSAKDKNDQRAFEKLGDELDAAFTAARGDIFETLRQAKGYAFEKATLARATGERFAGQLKAYDAAPEIYKRQQRLAVFEETLENTRKIVVAADQNDTQVFVIDLQEKLTPSLYDLGLEEKNGK